MVELSLEPDDDNSEIVPYPVIPKKKRWETKQHAHQSIGKATTGQALWRKNSWLWNNFNDLARKDAFPGCTHGLKRGEHHANGICSDRVRFVKELFELGLGHTEILQVDELVKLRLVEDKLLKDFWDHDKLNPELSRISRNIISLTDKIRKQNEGIKISQEVSIGVDEFRNLVEEQAKNLKREILIIPEREDQNGK